MSHRLRDNLTSSYVEAANRLNSKRARRKVVAYVESYDDVFFWRQILSQVETDRVCFEVMLPSREQRLERGKKAALMSMLKGKTGHDMVACVDADYDYLIQGASETSRRILQSPYVFHTYAYAIENLQCYAPSLHDVAVAVSLNDREVFDMEQYLRDFSQAIYPLFVWNIWYYRSPDYAEFTMTDFLRVVEVSKFGFTQADDIIRNVRRKAARKADQLRRQHPEAKQSWLRVKDDLLALGVNASNTYLYIQGHHLFDKVVIPMLHKVCDKLVRLRQEEIQQQSVHGVQCRNELSCYTNSVNNITPVLKRNAGFMRSPEYAKIKADLQRFVERISQQQPTPQPTIQQQTITQQSS
jgi:hypothetical protein